MAIGTTSDIESSDKGKIQDIVQKVKDLNGRLLDIKREQMFQRVNPSSPFFPMMKLTTVVRSGRLNLEINPSPPTAALSAGPSYSSLS